MLGQSEYGLYSLIISIVGYFSILDLGIGSTIIRYVAKNRVTGDKESESSLNGMFLTIYGIIGIISVISGFILYLNLHNIFGATITADQLGRARIMLLLLVLNTAITFPMSIFLFLMKAYERFVIIKILAIIRSIISPCIVIILLFLGFGVISLVVVNTILNIVFLIINLIYCIKILKIRLYFRKINFKLLKEIIRYSFFIFLNIIVDRIYWNIDQVILGILIGTMSVAVYAVAMQLNLVYLMFSTAISELLLPKISIMVANAASNEKLSSIMIRVGRIQYIIMAYILTSFILFGKAFIKLWVGPDYSNAYYIVLLIMIPITVPLIQNIGISILQAKNKHAFRSIVYLAIAILNIFASIPMAKVWGVLGCALATGVSLIIGNVIIMNIYYHKYIGLNIPLFWKNILLMSIPVSISLLGGYCINHFIIYNSFIYVALKIIIFSFIYITIMWIMSLNRYEKDIFLSPARMFIIRLKGNV